jgi:hypothetical protein
VLSIGDGKSSGAGLFCQRAFPHFKFPDLSMMITRQGSSKSESMDLREPWANTARSAPDFPQFNDRLQKLALVLQLEQELWAATYATCSIVTLLS